MRARRREADLEHVALAAARMEHRAAAAVAMGVDQIVDRRVEPGLRQRLDDEAALPVAIARGVPVLHRAAAADAEMRADRRDALGARGLDARADAARSGWPGQASTSTVSPGSVKGTKTGPSGVSAMPSPRWPRRAIVEPFDHGLR